MRFTMPKQTLKRMVWLLCIAAALTACKDKVEIIEEVRPIKTMTVSEQATGQTLKFSGLAAAVDSSGLSFQVGGQVASVEVDIGDRVKKGQVLAALDPEPYQLEVDAIKAELAKARDQVTRIKVAVRAPTADLRSGCGGEKPLGCRRIQLQGCRQRG
jgi:multidrug efflux system membrane fusion protein